MFTDMNKKWLKLGLILGAFALIPYVFLEFFFWGYLAERRFLKEEKIATKTYFENRNTFDEIRSLSVKLPSYNLNLNEKGKNYITLKIKEKDLDKRFNPSHFDYYQTQFSQGPIDTFINKEKWLLKIENAPNDDAFQEGLVFFKNNFAKFEKIRNGIKQINSTQISYNKNRSIHIQIKESLYEGLQYSHYYFDTSKMPDESEYYLGEIIDEYFYFQFYDPNPNSLFCGYSYPVWLVPESRFK